MACYRVWGCWGVQLINVSKELVEAWMAGNFVIVCRMAWKKFWLVAGYLQTYPSNQILNTIEGTAERDIQ